MNTRQRRLRAGFTLVETAIAATLFGVVVLGILMVSARDDQRSKAGLTIGVAEMRAQQMLAALQEEFVHARGAAPRAVLTQALSSNDTAGITVDSTLGFPDSGLLLIDRGNGSIERVRYAQLDATRTRFLGLTRGEQCTTANSHSSGADVLWVGLAEPILLQSSPPAALFDGRARSSTGPVFFRGDGAGFSYRVPVDPAGGADYLAAGNVRWGANVAHVGLEAGWAAVVFVPRFTYEESTLGFDLNADGDTLDVFDIGQLQRRTWDTSDPTAPPSELGLGPTVIVQERCNWGGDLNGDGFDDPMFLWNADTRRLHVKIHVLGQSSSNAPIMRAVETTIFLRNVPES
ncbi:MAG: hypothetical protein JNL28_10600 [Planctomycetes bacterium]|nr:hypothetical protein [Planctomycetota bacterium]